MNLSDQVIALHVDVVSEKFKMPKFKSIKKLLKKFKKSKPAKKPKVAFDAKKAKKKQGKSFWKKFFEGLNEEYSEDKISALAKYLKVDIDDIDSSDYALEVDGAEYEVLTDSEADEKLKEYIEDSLWAFNHDFLMSHIDAKDAVDALGLERSYYDEDTEEDVEIDDDEEVIYLNTGMNLGEYVTSLQEKYEDGNDEIAKIIGDIDSFVEDAEMSDGRGHFLSTYDGEELELEGGLYAYRTN